MRRAMVACAGWWVPRRINVTRFYLLAGWIPVLSWMTW